MEYDVVVRNGVVVDGSGAPSLSGADVAIKDRKIAALIDPARCGQRIRRARDRCDRACRRAGLYRFAFAFRLGAADCRSRANPETVSAARRDDVRRRQLRILGRACDARAAADARRVGPPVRRAHLRLAMGRRGLAAHLKRQGLALNVAHLAGHGSIRLSVMGSDAGEPSAHQLRAMQAMVERAMADGAVGLWSAGYFPGMIAKPAELGALARRRGGGRRAHLASACILGAIAFLRQSDSAQHPGRAQDGRRRARGGRAAASLASDFCRPPHLEDG